MTKEASRGTRAIVLDMLMEITSGQSYSHMVIKNVLDKYNYMDAQEKAFVKRLTEGTLERQIQLDYILNQFSKTTVTKMKPLIRNLLRMSVYQLLFMDRIPDSAVCNEAVRLAEKRKFHTLKGFVNGVLRNIARNKENIRYPDREKEPLSYLSVMYSMPEWIVKMWMADYGTETTERMLEALLQEHPVTIRLRENLTESEKTSVLDGLKAAGAELRQHPYLPYAFVLTHAEGMNKLAPFREGKIYVQDVSSMFVAECAGIRPGDRVLDVCAAPGGKSLHAADKLLAVGDTRGCVEARDVSEEKTELIRQNVERLGLSNVMVRVQDAVVAEVSSEESADVLLMDVPCSGLGVIGKKRDIKYNADPERMPELVKLQKDILRACIPYVKKGGTILFSTCTIHRAENEELLQWMLQEFPLSLQSLDEFLPAELHGETTSKGYLQFLPGIHQTDGFFLAKLRRREE
ncbi:MAG: 16S rRNA (cytosine(967)-C(5))-methyltransferase RsmB [Lachnospiraceae bacterium]|nr:16S rRNA (cytosine(967)-C(5))-methyltransferase RsmB [Lachnospiraceae bacterium]